MRIIALLGLLMLSGCMIQLDETVNTMTAEDITAWSLSAEARQGTIVLGSDISRASAVDVVRKMIALDNDPNIERVQLMINSNGGDTSALRTIYNAIRLSEKPVDTINVGNCYSAACAIFAAATGKRYAFANAHFMVHKPQAVGGLSRRYSEILDFEVEFFETVLKDSGLPAHWFPLTEKDQYFTAQEGKTFGFVDEVVETLP